MAETEAPSRSPLRRHCLVGISPELDFRPLVFLDPLPSSWTCDLCGLTPKTTVVLPCHVFCAPCYGKIVQASGTQCPIDSSAFYKDDVVHHVVAADQVLERDARCWNADHGCYFVGPLGTLVDHVEKECQFCTVRCVQCSEQVLRSNVLDHRLRGCGDASPPRDRKPDVLDDILREGTRINETLTSIAHSQNAVLEASTSLLETTRHSARDIVDRQVCHVEDLKQDLDRQLAPIRRELQVVKDGLRAVARLRSDLGEVLTARQLGCVVLHWKIRAFGENRQEAAKVGRLVMRSDVFRVCGYSLRLQLVWTTIEGNVLVLQLYLALCQGPEDLRLDWPFAKPYTLVLIHPRDKLKCKKVRVDPLLYPGAFCRPETSQNPGVGCVKLYRVSDLKPHGFVQDDSICVGVEVEAFGSWSGDVGRLETQVA